MNELPNELLHMIFLNINNNKLIKLCIFTELIDIIKYTINVKHKIMLNKFKIHLNEHINKKKYIMNTILTDESINTNNLTTIIYNDLFLIRKGEDINMWKYACVSRKFISGLDVKLTSWN